MVNKSFMRRADVLLIYFRMRAGSRFTQARRVDAPPVFGAALCSHREAVRVRR
jgi:hypothetical protein